VIGALGACAALLVSAAPAVGNPTATTVTCTPASLTLGAGSTLCRATVIDTVNMSMNPSGNVSFTSSDSGTFSGGGSCMVLGNAGQPGCGVTYTPTAVGSGSHQITGFYVSNDLDHDPSQGSTTVAVLAPPGSGPVPTGTPPSRKAIRKCKKKFPKGPKRKKCIKRAKKRALA
jgi:hypothetical protein